MAAHSRAGRPAGRTSISRRLIALADSADATTAERLRALELAAGLVVPAKREPAQGAQRSVGSRSGEDKAA